MNAGISKGSEALGRFTSGELSLARLALALEAAIDAASETNAGIDEARDAWERIELVNAKCLDAGREPTDVERSRVVERATTLLESLSA